MESWEDPVGTCTVQIGLKPGSFSVSVVLSTVMSFWHRELGHSFIQTFSHDLTIIKVLIDLGATASLELCLFLDAVAPQEKDKSPNIKLFCKIPFCQNYLQN